MSQASIGELFVMEDDSGETSYSITSIGHSAFEVAQYEGSGTLSNYSNALQLSPGIAGLPRPVVAKWRPSLIGDVADRHKMNSNGKSRFLDSA